MIICHFINKINELETDNNLEHSFSQIAHHHCIFYDFFCLISNFDGFSYRQNTLLELEHPPMVPHLSIIPPCKLSRTHLYNTVDNRLIRSFQHRSLLRDGHQSSQQFLENITVFVTQIITVPGKFFIFELVLRKEKISTLACILLILTISQIFFCYLLFHCNTFNLGFASSSHKNSSITKIIAQTVSARFWVPIMHFRRVT